MQYLMVQFVTDTKSLIRSKHNEYSTGELFFVGS